MIYYIPFIQSGCVFNATFNYAKVVWLNVVKFVSSFDELSKIIYFYNTVLTLSLFYTCAYKLNNKFCI